MTPLRILGLWAPVVAFMALIYGVSAQPEVPGAEYVWDKLAHTVAYGVFGVLCIRAFHGGLGPLRVGPTMLGALLTLCHGVFDEWHQSFVPGRDASVADIGADAVGGALALVLVGALFGVRRGSANDPRGNE